MTNSDDNTFDPMAAGKEPEKTGDSRLRTAFNIGSGFAAGVLTKWVTGNDYLAIAVAPVATHFVSKTSLFEAASKFKESFSASGDEPDVGSDQDQEPKGPAPA